MKRSTSFSKLTAAEREAVYERMEGVRPSDGAPLDARDRARHRRAGLKVGRPRVGKGARRINVSMEKGLLESADRFARRLGITRARLISESVKRFLANAA